MCLLGFVLLHLFTRHLRRYDGQTFLLYIIWYGVTRFFIEGLRTDSLLLPGIDLRVSQVLAAASALVAVVLLIVFRNCHKLTGCGSRKAMEAAGLTVEDKAEKVEIDDTAESTIFYRHERRRSTGAHDSRHRRKESCPRRKMKKRKEMRMQTLPKSRLMKPKKRMKRQKGKAKEKNDGSEN